MEANMASVLIRNLPDEVHRALRVRAAQHGRSTEAEVRDILEKIAKPPERVKLGSMLVSIAREAGGLTDAEAEVFDRIRDKTPAEPMRFE
jgi:plasmid stability protein